MLSVFSGSGGHAADGAHEDSARSIYSGCGFDVLEPENAAVLLCDEM